jgi:hypothetical protein
MIGCRVLFNVPRAWFFVARDAETKRNHNKDGEDRYKQNS